MSHQQNDSTSIKIKYFNILKMADLSKKSIKLEGAGKLLDGQLWFPTVMNYNLKHIDL